MLVTLLGAGALSLGSTIFGGVSAKKQNREQEEFIENQQRTLDYWYKKEMGKDYLDSDVAKSTISTLDKQNKKVQDAMLGNTVKNNSTSEEKVAMASSLSGSYADSISKLAANEERRKDKVEDIYLNKSNSLSNAMQNNLSNRASISSSTIASAANTIGNTIATLGVNDVFKKEGTNSF